MDTENRGGISGGDGLRAGSDRGEGEKKQRGIPENRGEFGKGRRDKNDVRHRNRSTEKKPVSWETDRDVRHRSVAVQQLVWTRFSKKGKEGESSINMVKASTRRGIMQSGEAKRDRVREIQQVVGQTRIKGTETGGRPRRGTGDRTGGCGG